MAVAGEKTRKRQAAGWVLRCHSGHLHPRSGYVGMSRGPAPAFSFLLMHTRETAGQGSNICLCLANKQNKWENLAETSAITAYLLERLDKFRFLFTCCVLGCGVLGGVEVGEQGSFLYCSTWDTVPCLAHLGQAVFWVFQ